jgi:hypothetical protein
MHCRMAMGDRGPTERRRREHIPARPARDFGLNKGQLYRAAAVPDSLDLVT